MVQVKIQKSLDYLLESIYNSNAHCSFAPSIKLMARARTWGTEHVFPESISLSKSVLLTTRCLKLLAAKNYIFPTACSQVWLMSIYISVFSYLGYRESRLRGNDPLCSPCMVKMH